MSETVVISDGAARVWPPGFQVNPLRFVRSQAAWRAVALTVVLGVLALPQLVLCVMMLPGISLVAALINQLARLGAAWMGIRVVPRKRTRWFDWRQFVFLLFHCLLSFFCLVFVVVVGTLTVVSVYAPIQAFFDNDQSYFDLGFYRTSSPYIIMLFFWPLALIFFYVFIQGCWLLAGTSVAAVSLSNALWREDIAKLERSRTVLIDAFTGERRRIERELHDGVQQYLTALQLNIATAELIASRSNSDVAEQLEQPINQARLNARRALEALRSTIRGIYPQVLQDKGLLAALDELVAHSGIKGEVRQSLTPGVSTQLSATPALLLYHCAAEGITNAVKHGSASQIQVGVFFNDQFVVLFVDDNGVGVAAEVETQGTGITGLRERAAALGGTVMLAPSNFLSGVSLRIQLPRTTVAS